MPNPVKPEIPVAEVVQPPKDGLAIIKDGQMVGFAILGEGEALKLDATEPLGYALINVSPIPVGQPQILRV